jgi:hypothetical protein
MSTVFLVGKHEDKRPLGRHGRRWEENVRTDLREIRGGGSCGVDATD